jgi:acetyl esterase
MPADHAPLVFRLRIALARWLSRLPAGVLVRLSGEPPVVVDGNTLDPHVQLIRALRRRHRVPGLTEPEPIAARARYRREMIAVSGRKTRVGAVRDCEIAGAAGLLRVRHYAPGSGDGRPLTVYLHGGGFMIGDLDTHDEPCRILCREARTHVLSVDYRLAPEHPFPAALDDTLAALRWAQAHASDLGADPRRVAVGGDSAGGNLATVAAILASREGTPPAAQLLIYPTVDARTKRPSRASFGEGYFLDRADHEAFSLAYGGGAEHGDDWRVSPLLAPDLAGLPPALVVTVGFDFLRDEGLAYADALEAAGTPVRRISVPAQGHGFIHMTGINPDANRAMVGIARAWGEVLEGVERSAS